MLQTAINSKNITINFPKNISTPLVPQKHRKSTTQITQSSPTPMQCDKIQLSSIRAFNNGFSNYLCLSHIFHNEYFSTILVSLSFSVILSLYNFKFIKNCILVKWLSLIFFYCFEKLDWKIILSLHKSSERQCFVKCEEFSVLLLLNAHYQRLNLSGWILWSYFLRMSTLIILLRLDIQLY